EIHLGDFNGGFDRLQVDNAVVNGNGSFTGGIARNVYPLVRGMYNEREDSIKAFGWKNELSFESWRLMVDMSWSKAEREETNLENPPPRVPSPRRDSATLDFSANGSRQRPPGLDSSTPAALSLTTATYGPASGKVPQVEAELGGF